MCFWCKQFQHLETLGNSIFPGFFAIAQVHSVCEIIAKIDSVLHDGLHDAQAHGITEGSPGGTDPDP